MCKCMSEWWEGITEFYIRVSVQRSSARRQTSAQARHRVPVAFQLRWKFLFPRESSQLAGICDWAVPETASELIVPLRPKLPNALGHRAWNGPFFPTPLAHILAKKISCTSGIQRFSEKPRSSIYLRFLRPRHRLRLLSIRTFPAPRPSALEVC